MLTVRSPAVGKKPLHAACLSLIPRPNARLHARAAVKPIRCANRQRRSTRLPGEDSNIEISTHRVRPLFKPLPCPRRQQEAAREVLQVQETSAVSVKRSRVRVRKYRTQPRRGKTRYTSVVWLMPTAHKRLRAHARSASTLGRQTDNSSDEITRCPNSNGIRAQTRLARCSLP